MISQPVEDVNQLAQSAVVVTIETEGNARQMKVSGVGNFLGRRRNDFYRRAVNDVGEILVHRGNGGFAWHVLEPDDERVFDPTRRMKIAIETSDDFYRFIGAVSDLIKVEVVGRNQFVPQ